MSTSLPPRRQTWSAACARASMLRTPATGLLQEAATTRAARPAAQRSLQPHRACPRRLRSCRGGSLRRCRRAAPAADALPALPPARASTCARSVHQRGRRACSRPLCARRMVWLPPVELATRSSPLGIQPPPLLAARSRSHRDEGRTGTLQQCIALDCRHSYKCESRLLQTAAAAAAACFPPSCSVSIYTPCATCAHKCASRRPQEPPCRPIHACSVQGGLALCAYVQSGDPEAEALEALGEVAGLDGLAADQASASAPGQQLSSKS